MKRLVALALIGSLPATAAALAAVMTLRGRRSWSR